MRNVKVLLHIILVIVSINYLSATEPDTTNDNTESNEVILMPDTLKMGEVH